MNVRQYKHTNIQQAWVTVVHGYTTDIKRKIEQK